MIIEPRIRGFICMTAHPDGCAAHVAEQIDYVQRQPTVDGPRRVLVIGASTGYGLASRIVAAFGCGADTVGVFFERPASRRRTASAGWYNSAAFERAALAAGRGAWSINGDAFSNEIREQTVELVAKRLGQVDLVVYSLASPRRIHPDTGETFNSVLKPIGGRYSGTTIDPNSGAVTTVHIDPADEADIAATMAVMGGDDWRRWSAALHGAGLLAPGCRNLAYTYAGPTYTHAIYRAGTIGHAKQHLERTAGELDRELPARSLVSVNKALVTQSSAAIPVIPLYLMLLFRVMKERGSHEGAIEQIYRRGTGTDRRLGDGSRGAAGGGPALRRVRRRPRRRPGGGTGRPGRLPRRLSAPVRLRPARHRLRRRRRRRGNDPLYPGHRRLAFTTDGARLGSVAASAASEYTSE